MTSWLDDLDQAVQEEASGSGGYVGKFNITTGYKIFVSGLSNDESFFECDLANKKSREDALEMARSVLDRKGADDEKKKRPNLSVQITLYQDSVLNRDVSSWSGDRVFVHPTWTDNYKEVVRPKLGEAMKAAGKDGAGDYWGRITFMPDLSGRMRKDQPDKPELFAYIPELYKNKKEAEEAAEAFQSADSDAEGSDSNDGDRPKGYENEKAWNIVKDDVLKEINKGTSIEDVAEDYDIDPKWLKKWYAKQS